MNMKMTDIRKLTPDERLDRLLQLRKNLMESRFKRVAGQAEKTHEIRAMRRTIARIKTLLATENKMAVENKTAVADNTATDKAATDKTAAEKTTAEKTAS